MDEAHPVPPDARVPLVIGITGHRDVRPEDRDELQNIIKRILLSFRADYPSTPLVMLSPLAEGADRLAARAALDPQVNARLVVPLPLPRALYEEDFKQNPHSIEEFRDLLARASDAFPVDLAPGIKEEEIAVQGRHRDAQYEAVGKYVARHSQVLIALWDGVEGQFVGGTAAIVRFKMEGAVEREIDPLRQTLLEPTECGPVYHVATPRVKNPRPRHEPLTLQKRYPDVHSRLEAEAYFARIFRRMDTFNRDAAAGGALLGVEVVKSKGYVMPADQEPILPAGLSSTLDRYGLADALAIRFQRRTTQAMKVLHVSVFVAALCFAVFAHFHRVWLLAPCAGAIAVALLTYGVAKRGEYQDKHQDYRALAEGLRVKFFWWLAGIHDRITDYYLGKQRTELDWIRYALRGWSIGERGPHTRDHLRSAAQSEEALRTVLERWVDNQLRYFTNAAHFARMRLEAVDRWVTAAMVTTFVLALLLVVIPPLSGFGTSGSWGGCCAYEGLFTDLGVVAISTCLVLAALIHHYSERMAYAEHAKQYARMQRLFGRASDLVAKALNVRHGERARDLIRELGREALAENGDWVLLHRERPLDVPHAS